MKSKVDLDRFFGRVREAAERLLILDYDGTLAPFRIERNHAVPYPGVAERIETIPGRVVIVSGRRLEDLIPLLGLRRLPELWGSHGWERRSAAGKTKTLEPAGDARTTLEEARRWARDEGVADRCEFKPASVAFHWRGLGDEEAARFRTRILEATPRNALDLLEFDGGIELRAPGRNKGDVVRELLAGAPSTVAAYLGDDTTDEDAFAALGPGNLGVLVRPERRESRADVWIRPPDELLEFLDRWSISCR